MSVNALTIRDLNINQVREALKTFKQATKQQLAEATGLTTVTVASIIQQLVENKEAYEVDQAPSRGGRPASRFQFNENFSHVLALYTHEQDGRDMLHVRVANLYGECVEARDAVLQEIFPDTFESWIDGCLQAYPSIRAIGLGLPGFEVDGKIVQVDYPHLMGAPLTDLYARRYRLPVIFENDVNAAAAGYCKQNEILSSKSIVYVYFPKKYAPGAGIFLHGQLYKGSSNFAGEVGSMPLGVDWLAQSLYQSAQQFCPAIARVVIAISSLLNPDIIVLHGSFLSDATVKKIGEICAAQLPETSMPSLLLSADFTADFQAGMISATLNCLQPRLSLV